MGTRVWDRGRAEGVRGLALAMGRIFTLLWAVHTAGA